MTSDVEKKISKVLRTDMPARESAGDAPSIEDDKRVAFARSTLDGIQALIRSMDTKAQFIVAVSGLLTGSLVPLLMAGSTAANPHIFPSLGSTILGGGCVLITVLAVIVAILASICVMYARGTRGETTKRLPGLIFPSMIIDSHGTSAVYAQMLRDYTYDSLIDEFAQQIVECSLIYIKKSKLVRAGFIGLSVGLTFWVILVLTKLWILLSRG